MARVAPELPAKVLIVRLGAIGDVVNAQVVANAIKEARPRTFVGWVVHDLSRPLLQGHPSVDRVHLWPRGSGLAGARAVARELRRERYGLTLNLQRTAKSGLLARSSGAGKVVGFDRGRARELSWLLSSERIPAGRPGSHMLEWYLEFVDHLGLAPPRVLHRFPRDARAAAWAEGLVQELGAPPVLVHLGASKPRKRWPAERVGRLVAQLATGHVGPVCLTGGPGDAADVDAVLAACGEGGVARDLVGRTSLLQLLELERRARLFLGSDTGPMHMAVAVGTPTVALFGPGEPERTGPWGPGHAVVRSATGRMQELSVDEVLEAARRLLAQPAPQR